MAQMTIQIGTSLRKIMKEQRLTLKEIATGSGVPATTIADWSNNRSPKNLIHAQNVAAFLGVSLHFLLFGQEDREEPLMKLLKEDIFSGTFEINIKKVRMK